LTTLAAKPGIIKGHEKGQKRNKEEKRKAYEEVPIQEGVNAVKAYPHLEDDKNDCKGYKKERILERQNEPTRCNLLGRCRDNHELPLRDHFHQ